MKFSLSFIFPFFNELKYLERELNSLELQLLRNITVKIILELLSNQFRGFLKNNDKSKSSYNLKTSLNYNLNFLNL